MGNGSIRTQFDDMLSALKSAGKPVSVPDLSAASGMSNRDVINWLHVLEGQEKVHIENRFGGVFATWLEPAETSKPQADPSVVDVSDNVVSLREAHFERELSIARQHEQHVKDELGKGKQLPVTAPSATAAPEPKRHKVALQKADAQVVVNAPKRHKAALQKADAQISEIGKQLEQVETMISVLRQQKKLAGELREKIAEKKNQKAAPGAEKHDEHQEPSTKMGEIEQEKAEPEEEMPPVIEMTIDTGPDLDSIDITEKPDNAEKPNEDYSQRQSAPEIEKQAEAPEQQSAQEAPAVPMDAEREEELKAAFSSIKPIAIAKTQKKGAIKKPQPLHVAGVSLQFSERLARQVQKILNQNNEIDKLRSEKEKLLTEHYLPMQRKLESEIETISDRVLRMEKNILGMQERASNLPNKVSAVEKLQLSSIKAHGQMRRVYDEASALIEESSRELSDGREKMETMVEQSRQEIAAHRSKTVELEKTLSHISQLEQEASNRVIEARSALAEQAERLASAEGHARELVSLKSEISASVSTIKHEIGTTKAVLTNIEKQMEQIRQVELYAESLRQDYGQKMAELGDYIKHGNEDFDTLRESVEANFVRRYLKDLRELTDGYSFEFSQAKMVEGNIDERIYDEKMKLEGLIEEGKKISHLYELQSKEVQGAEKFEQRGEQLAEIEKLSEKRTQIEGMIAQIVGNRGEYQPKLVASSPIKSRKYSKKKAPTARKKAGKAKPSKKKAKLGKKR